MNEGISTPKREGADSAGDAGGFPTQNIPTVKKFFLVEYFEEVLRGFSWMRGAPRPDEGVIPRVGRAFTKWSKGKKARIGAVVVIVIMVAASALFSAQASYTPVNNGSRPGGGGGGGGGSAGNYTNRSAVGENSEVTLIANFKGSGVFKTMTATLTWTDESSPALQTNQPDSLGFDVVAPSGQNWSAGMATNPVGGSGRVTWALNDTTTNFGVAGWQLIIKGGTMGDFTRPTGRACFLCASDNTNAFTVTVDYTY